MADALPQRKKAKKWKRGRKDLNTNLMEVVGQLKPHNLQGLLLGTAVWLACDGTAVYLLDTLCLGNLDGGEGTAQGVAQQLAATGAALAEDASKAVRLSLEEAFFMAYTLRVLAVHEPQGVGQPPVALDDEALWQRLQRARPDFLLQYLAYHHFRSKGWIPRTGLQYGADMVLYQRHPALAHADYSVLIVPRGGRWRPELSWHDVQVLNRLTAQVSKKLLLLYVQEEGRGPGSGSSGGVGSSGGGGSSSSGSSSEYSSPRCLARFVVQERIVRRWVPDAHRPA